MSKKRFVDEPNMSDNALLVTVEDLINQAMGPPDVNTVNFKVIQAVLHILARQQRILEQRVEINIGDLTAHTQKMDESSESSISSSPRGRMAHIREEREPRARDRAQREREKEERAATREQGKAQKEREKADRAASKERERADKAATKQMEKEEKTASKERERADKAASKERERADKAASKEREKEEKAASKERDKAERAASKERDKEERAASKERDKAERAASKERDKAERATSKEREKEERAASKERGKEEKAALKEKEKAEKAQSKAEKTASKEKEKEEKTASKEREKAEKAASKEKEKAEKAAMKEQEKEGRQAQKEQEKAAKQSQKAEKAEKEGTKSAKGERKTSATGISVKDAQARGSIEVVTQSQFALLEAAIRELREMAAPQPLAMPDNVKLRSDLAKGQATLPDTMQAMQIDARVKAAENAIGRMTGLLTQLAAAGELPEELEKQMENIEAERAAAEREAQELRARPSLGRKSVIIAPSAKASEASGRPSIAPRPSTAPAPRPSVSIMKQPSSRASTMTVSQGVSRDEMDGALNSLREDLIKSMNTLTARAAASADNALNTAKSAAEKTDVAKSLDARISTLHSLALDYADQLNGFDAGLTTQMQSFREQMVQMRGDLKGGLNLLESVNNNAETAAVVELTARYQELVTELETTLHSHRALTKVQSQLTDELRSLVECVELLREQKADRDEVADGLRDKADTSRLAGLLTESEFALARADLERRLAVCHDKFQRQDNVWMTAVKDLNKIMEGKSEIIDLLSCRDEVQKQLQTLLERLQVLAAVLGEPKAAAVKRQLAVGAACVACGAPALMSPRDANGGAPPRLPALRPPPAGAADPKTPCLKDWMPPDLPDDRHVCRRWCGGSHTLVSESTRHEQASSLPADLAPPTKRYTGYGSDGRLYMMEEELQPCVECNQIVPPLDLAAGDQKQRETVVNINLKE